MLGGAFEGAWTLVGEALIASQPGEPASIALQRDLDGRLEFGRLIEAVLAQVDDPTFSEVIARSGVKPRELRSAATWTHQLRLACNAVHHDVDAPLPPTWESSAALLMGATVNLRALWAVTRAARDAAPDVTAEPIK